MDLLEGLYTRRSVRKFTEEAVSDSDIHVLLKSAMLAPSAKNQQPWHFIVVKEKAMRDKLAAASPYTGMAAHAPLVVVICGDTANEKAPGFWVQDCSAAAENLLLAARALNLGSVWCGIYPEKERMQALATILGLPDKVLPLNMICIGHTEMQFKEADRFNPERVHHEKW